MTYFSEQTDAFNARALPPSSTLQIKRLNDQYSAPKPKLELTPTGARWKEGLTKDELEKNRAIQERTGLMQRRLNRRKNQLKQAMNRAADRRSGQQRRSGRDLGR